MCKISLLRNKSTVCSNADGIYSISLYISGIPLISWICDTTSFLNVFPVARGQWLEKIRQKLGSN